MDYNKLTKIADATGDKVNIHTDIEGIEVGKDDDSNRIIKTRDEKGNDQVIKVNKQNEVVNDGCCGGKKSSKKKPVKKVSDDFVDPFNFYPNDDESKKPTHRINYYDYRGASTSSPAIFNSDDEAIEAARKNRGPQTHGFSVQRYATSDRPGYSRLESVWESGALGEHAPEFEGNGQYVKDSTTPEVDKFMEAIQIFSNKYNDPSKVSVTKTPKGNWDVKYDGKRLGIINANMLDEDTASAQGWITDASSSDTRKEHMLEWMKQNKSMLNQFLKDVLHQSIQTETWKNEYRDMTMDDIINGYSAPWSSRPSYEGEARRERSELTRKGTEGKNDMTAKSIINELGIDINHSDVSVGHYNAADGIEYLTIHVEPFIDDNNASIEDINSKVVEKYGEDADARKNKFGDLIISIPSNEVSITDAAEDAPTSRVSGLAKRDRSLDHNWSVDDYKVAYIIAEFGKKGIEAVAKKCGMAGLNSNTAVATYLINTSDAGLQLALTGIRKYVTGDYGTDENEFLSSYKMNQNFLTAYNELDGKSLEECVASVNPDNVGDKDANIAGLEKKHAEKNLKANERQKLETERKAALRDKLKHIESTALTHRVKNKLSKPQSEKLAKKDHGWTAEDEADAKKFGLIDSIRKMNDNCQTDRYAEFSISPEAIYGILTEGESSVKIPNNGMNVNDYAKSCIKVMQGIAKDCGNKLPSIQYSIVGDEICFKVK